MTVDTVYELWVALEPDWQPIRIAAADIVWGVVSPDGQRIIAQLCVPAKDDRLPCEHWLGPLHGPLERVGAFEETDYWVGPRRLLYEFGVGGTTTVLAGFSPDGAWVWWQEGAWGEPTTLMLRRLSEPGPLVQIPDRRGWEGVVFSADSRRMFVETVSGTAIVVLDQPEIAIRSVQDRPLRLCPDGPMALIERRGEGDATRRLVVRSDWSVLAPQDAAVLHDAVFLDRSVLLSMERESRFVVVRYDQLTDQERVLLDVEHIVVTRPLSTNAKQAAWPVALLGSPDRRSFVVLLTSVDNPPADSGPSLFGRTIHRQARLFSDDGAELRDFGPAVYGCNGSAVQYSPNGRYLLIARPERESLMVDLDNGREEPFPSTLLSPGAPPGADVTTVGTLWTPGGRTDIRSGAWISGRGFQEIELAAFQGLSPSGRHALLGPPMNNLAAVATADASRIWLLPLSNTFGWSNDPGRAGRLLYGLSCGV